SGLIYSSENFSFSFPSHGKNHMAAIEEDDEENSDHPNKDHMDLAMQQEFERTKDLTTGTVPRERLVAAYNYAQQQRNSRGAISNIKWMERGPLNVSGRTRTIMVDPNDVTGKSVFTAGVGGGLWKTTDITAQKPTWTMVNDFFANLAITTIAYSPLATQTMYFGTGEGWFNLDAIRGNGIWKSTDGGATFNQLAATTGSNYYYIQKIVVHPTTGDLYAATRSGVFRTQNGGTSWTKVLGAGTGAATDNISDLEIAADNSIYAGLGIFGTDGVYRSTTGATGAWTKLNTGANGFPTTGFYRTEIACAPSAAGTVYVMTESSATDALFNIYKTTNSGTTWTTCTLPTDADPGIAGDITRTQGWYDLIAAVDPNDANKIVVGGVDLFRSTNGGTSWTQLTHWYGGYGFQYVHADQHALCFQPGNSSNLYFGNDGGIWRSADGGVTITSKQENNNITEFYCCAMSPTAYSNYFLAGAQDNGSQKFQKAGLNDTYEITGGDGAFCHIDQNQSQYQWTSYVNNSYYRSSDGGVNFTGATLSTNTGAHFINVTDYDDVGNIMYCADGNGKYCRWSNPQSGAANVLVTVTAFGSSGSYYPTAITVSPNTSNRVFFGLSNGKVVLVDAANLLTVITGVHINNGAGMPAGSVSCIAVESGNDNHLLVSYFNYGVTSIWETTNGGSTWTSVEGNLPDMPVRWCMFNPNNNTQAVIATELGVWSTDLLNGASTVWGASTTGLANVRTDMLQYRSSDGFVIAATHGRGLFSTDAFTTAHVDFGSDHTVHYINRGIKFYDNSYQATSWAWDFGDGNTSTTQNPTHSYSAAGVYTVSLTINGTLTKSVTGYITILPNRGTPYLSTNGGSFDVNPNDFAAESFHVSAFTSGSSTQTNKNGTYNGTNAWVSDLSSASYSNGSVAYLYTPNYNMTSTGNYTISFYSKYNVENQFDGFNVEYSLDKGLSWNTLGTTGGSWYNYANNTAATSFPIFTPYFTGSNTTFTNHSYTTSALGGNANLAFRFVFMSDNTVTAPGVALDNFEVIGVTNVLPITLVSFTGENNGSHNLILWKTESEINNKGFQLLRSADGINFSSIAFVDGGGTTYNTSDYNFTDKNLQSEIYYYRLQQIDFDNTESYSNIIAIYSPEIQTSVVVAPTVFNESILISGIKNEKNIKLFFYNTEGQLIQSCEENLSDEKNISVPTKTLAQEIYFLIIISTEGKNIFTGKIIKV
ncbi:MAG: PKD domain-containing protein, partial [Sphingobacteriales bacterium]